MPPTGCFLEANDSSLKLNVWLAESDPTGVDILDFKFYTVRNIVTVTTIYLGTGSH